MTDLNTVHYFYGWTAGWPQLLRIEPPFGSRRQSSGPAKSRGRRAGVSLGAVREPALLPMPHAGAGAGQAAAGMVEFGSGRDLPEQRAAVPADSDASGRTIPKFERRFRAVLVADVGGYTPLMGAGELETHARYRTLRVGGGGPTTPSPPRGKRKKTRDGFLP